MNIPLNDGIDDESYEQLFKPIMRKVVEVYKPEVIVFQSGECIFCVCDAKSRVVKCTASHSKDALYLGLHCQLLATIHELGWLKPEG